jgi:hypothetical protein
VWMRHESAYSVEDARLQPCRLFLSVANDMSGVCSK